MFCLVPTIVFFNVDNDILFNSHCFFTISLNYIKVLLSLPVIDVVKNDLSIGVPKVQNDLMDRSHDHVHFLQAIRSDQVWVANAPPRLASPGRTRDSKGPQDE